MSNKENLKGLDEYKESLEIYRNLAEENPNVYLPDVALTLCYLANSYAMIATKQLQDFKNTHQDKEFYIQYLNDLASFGQDFSSNIELSIKYLNEAAEVLSKCNNKPFIEKEALNIETISAILKVLQNEYQKLFI